MEYKHKLVQAIAEFWEEWQPKMEASVESMPAMERLFFRQALSILNISTILEYLDNSPDTVELIREKLLKVVLAEGEMWPKEEREEGEEGSL